MKPKKLIWQIFPANVLTILVAIVVVSWYGATTLQEFYLQETEADLEARARLISSKIDDFLKLGAVDDLKNYCVQAGRKSATRITLIDQQGKVLADSNENPEVMDNHRYRQEIDVAFGGNVGISRRYSKTIGEYLIYVAIPLEQIEKPLQEPGLKNGVDYVVRTSVSVASLEATFQSIKMRIIGGSFAVMVLAGFVTLLVSRNVSKPLEQMTKSAEQFSQGDFSERMLPVANKTASLEIVTLAASMDRMAALLDEKIQAIVTHRNQLETVFSSMIEAVIAIDTEERVISLNEAAASLFKVDRKKSTGKIVQQIVRHVKLQQKISHTLSTKEPIEDEITLHDVSGERYLQCHVVALSNGHGEYVGVLVVMNDVTRLRRLEEVRRDFVANVSHELRTPITSIRGYVETLLDGGLDDHENAENFLEIVFRQSQRLATIIDDLLSLSRIEEESREGVILREERRLLPVLEAAVQTCEVNAEQSRIELELACPEDLVVLMNGALIEQALVNLIVNAITYSQEGSKVSVQVADKEIDGERTVHITVRDRGCGISKEHLPRLFERFYRSDKARSRTHGGTGLGLAIVKHIAQAHDGTIEVESVVGKGSAFTLVLGGNVES